MTTQLELFAKATNAPLTITRERYAEACRKRWSGNPLRDALGNWATWRKHHELLDRAMVSYLGNDDSSDSLTGFLWNLQAEVQPDRSYLYPFLDFEENFQRAFIRRGLLIYCAMILRQLEAQRTAGTTTRHCL